MGGYVLRVTFEPCRLYGDGRVREKKWGGHGPPVPPVSDAYVSLAPVTSETFLEKHCEL